LKILKKSLLVALILYGLYQYNSLNINNEIHASENNIETIIEKDEQVAIASIEINKSPLRTIHIDIEKSSTPIINNHIDLSLFENISEYEQIKYFGNDFDCIYDYLHLKSNEILGDYINNSISEGQFNLFSLKYNAVYHKLISEQAKIIFNDNSHNTLENNFVLEDFLKGITPLPHLTEVRIKFNSLIIY
jgi:hypothetical protein